MRKALGLSQPGLYVRSAAALRVPARPPAVAARSTPTSARGAHGPPVPGLALPALPARMMPTAGQAQSQDAASRAGQGKEQDTTQTW
jgi:hypothetical protein